MRPGDFDKMRQPLRLTREPERRSRLGFVVVLFAVASGAALLTWALYGWL